MTTKLDNDPKLLIQDLKNWAKIKGVSKDEYLTELISALENKEDLSYWAGYKQSEWFQNQKA